MMEVRYEGIIKMYKSITKIKETLLSERLNADFNHYVAMVAKLSGTFLCNKGHPRTQEQNALKVNFFVRIKSKFFCFSNVTFFQAVIYLYACKLLYFNKEFHCVTMKMITHMH